MGTKRRTGWQKFSYFFAMVPLDAPASLRRTIHWTRGLGYSPSLPGARRMMSPHVSPRFDLETLRANAKKEPVGLRRLLGTL